ncbi:MAG TPA: response regulator [Actinomycetota bacterium]|nr:response regulator [Actinomycetota bacterium]
MARILIAEDNAEIRALVSSILAEEGHKVSVAQNGQQALDMMGEDAPDLLVLDIMMPQVDGYGVLKELRNTGLRDTVKILVLTAKTSESDWVRGYKLGADSYITKPFDIDELTNQVNELLSMTKDQLRLRREQELDKAQLLSRLESIFDT